LFISTCAENAGVCSNPTANVTLTNQRSLLQTNQPYNIILDLELPESEANKQLGMFMVKVDFSTYNLLYRRNIKGVFLLLLTA